MIAEVFFSPSVVDEAAVEGRDTVVIDVIRATSTVVEALANGARAIFPTVSTEEAVKLASSLGREETLLCGERKGLMVEGFDLGNSPSEYTPEAVNGKQLVMTTTNGTRAFSAVEGARRIVAASFLNLSAVVETLASSEELVIVCAGRENRFALDDALCAGLLLNAWLAGAEEEPRLNDGARVVSDIARTYELSADFLRSTAAGQALMNVGLEDDLRICADRDRHALVPEMMERRITIPKMDSRGRS